jgi:TonB family protein
MNTREEFGNYLLLKKLTDDPLGETFRAGRLGRQGLDQVVLLRVLNGQGLDAERLWSVLADRQEVQKALKSPNIGSGVDADTVRGVPYVAYDYISGKDLATLIAQAERESSPFPTDHALLIADRIGLALTAAYEARHGGERVLHGMVIPHLAMVSNEGETRLLGFEAGPALGQQAGALPEEVQRYLAPEVRSGGKPTKTGDVFSLGAILYELLTGQALPAAAPDGYAPLVDQARLAAESTALPPALVDLLKRSLAPAEERIADAAAWHKALSKIMSDGGYNATTFNLAFFMHNLFREEIERESREIEAEKTMEIPTRGASVAGAGAETQALSEEEVRQATAPAEDTGAMRQRYGIEEESKGGKKGLWIGLAAAVVVVGGAVGAYFLTDGFSRGLGAETETQAETTAPPQPVPEPEPTPAEPEGPSPDEIQDQINQMLEEKTEALQADIKQEYDQRIAEMQRQLAAAEEAAQEREQRLAEAEERRARERTAQAAEEPAAEPAAGQEEPAGGGDRQASATPPAREQSGEPAGGSTSGGTPAGQQARSQPAKTQKPAEPAPREPEPEPEPKEPTVQVGDLVKPGLGVTQPRVVKRAAPTYPPVAARLNREATVDVQVLVDENGRVVDARISGKRPRFGFDEAALDAARASVFAPAEKDGVRVKMWTTIRFVFTR